MPAALQRVESASKFLEEASAMLSADPYSQPARKKLIGMWVKILIGYPELHIRDKILNYFKYNIVTKGSFRFIFRGVTRDSSRNFRTFALF